MGWEVPVEEPSGDLRDADSGGSGEDFDHLTLLGGEVELDEADPTFNAAAAVLADSERVVRRRRRNGGWGGHLRGVTVVSASKTTP